MIFVKMVNTHISITTTARRTRLLLEEQKHAAVWMIVIWPHQISGAPNDNFRKNIFSEDDLRSRIFGTFARRPQETTRLIKRGDLDITTVPDARSLVKNCVFLDVRTTGMHSIITSCSCVISMDLTKASLRPTGTKKKAPFRCFLAFKHYKQYFSHCFTVDSRTTMKYHTVWITTAGRRFCKMFDKSLYDYYGSFTNEGIKLMFANDISRKLIVKFELSLALPLPALLLSLICTRSFGKNSLLHLSFKETIFPETCLQIKDNNNSPHGKFHSVSLGYLCLKPDGYNSVRFPLEINSLESLFHHFIFFPQDCSDLLKSGHTQNGVYSINPDGRGSFNVYCDMRTDGGGWTVFQRRQDGSVDFYRGWNDYKSGFGPLTADFWLGNDRIHRLTAARPSALRVELEDWNGVRVYAKYGKFKVGDEQAKYRLEVGSYSGTAGDSIVQHNNMAFSTKDRDNDIWSSNCAVTYTGAWWYESCHSSNLNGKYLGRKYDYRGACWSGFRGAFSLKFTEMKLRPSS
ncbi:unnamed protein product [Porites evermanni]|uniref:Fibrinogen C-terminal domain-containing protein n=1 Tax=Porites evermanni TaxID=104178 RepID=A0ABN8SFF8_9CNID|nr:unnamed protein product [Porites evermanni]